MPVRYMFGFFLHSTFDLKPPYQPKHTHIFLKHPEIIIEFNDQNTKHHMHIPKNRNLRIKFGKWG
jgi:uncharacterized protein YccT (UPF0319 family)